MDDGEDDFDHKTSGMIWTVASGFLFLAFAIGQYSFSTLAMAISGAVTFPALRQVWTRYGLIDRRKPLAAISAAGLAIFAYLVAPSPTRTEESTDRAVSAEVDEADPAGEVDEGATDHDSIAAAPEISGCSTVDGDTLNCPGEVVRLIGIDAPEMPGHCAQARICAPGDPYASRQSLAGILQYSMKIVRVGQDKYGRTLAVVYADGQNLSCYQLDSGQADYVSAWDEGGRVLADCPGVEY